MMVVEIRLLVKLSFGHRFKLVMESCFLLGMVDKGILKLTALIYFAFCGLRILDEMS